MATALATEHGSDNQQAGDSNQPQLQHPGTASAPVQRQMEQTSNVGVTGYTDTACQTAALPDAMDKAKGKVVQEVTKSALVGDEAVQQQTDQGSTANQVWVSFQSVTAAGWMALSQLNQETRYNTSPCCA